MGAVNLGVIDAVNARMAAVNGPSTSGEKRSDLFRAMRIETSVDNVENNNDANGGDIEVG